MRLLTADVSLPARRRQPVPFLGEPLEVVLPTPSEAIGWHFSGVRTGCPCGSSARVEELPASPRSIAELMAEHVSGLDIEGAALVILTATAWLQSFPQTTIITISPSGLERAPPQAALDPDWLRENAERSGWATAMRQAGHLPLLVKSVRGLWRLVAVPAMPGVFLNDNARLAWVRRHQGCRLATEVRDLVDYSQALHSEGP